MNKGIERNSNNLINFVILAAVLTAIVILWEYLAAGKHISQMFFPAPSSILTNTFDLIQDGRLGQNFSATLKRLTLGLVGGCVPGILLGLIMGWSKRVKGIVDPLIAALHPIPKISILPLIMVIFGIGDISKVIVISLSAFFPTLINTMAGVRHIDPVYFDVAHNYGANFVKIFQRVALPASLPMIASGIRIALNTALVVTIAVELIASKYGLGSMIWLSWQTLRTKDLYSSLLFIAFLGITSNLLLQFIIDRLLPWYRKNTL